MVRGSQTENETQSLFTRAGRKLTQAQVDRRAMMKGLLAAGAYASLAGMPSRAFAQATPEASPVPDFYDGALADEQTFRLPAGEPVTMDPGVSYGDNELAVLFNIYDGLTGVDQRTGEVVGRVAESWTTNDDASVYTFTLKQGVTWSDGTPITANDFVYSWQRVLDPNTLSEYTSALYPLLNGEEIANGEKDLTELGVKAIDDTTLEVTLTGPMTFFPLLAATWTFYPVPKHIIDEYGDGWTDSVYPGVSNGPFIVESWNHDQDLTLIPNPAYTTGDAVTLTKATFVIYDDATTQAFIAFENDELDYAAPEGADLDRVLGEADPAYQVIQFSQSNCNFLVVDTREAPGNSLEFRQALYKSVNRDELANVVLRGQYLPAYTIVSSDIPGSLQDVSPLTESVDEAVALLASAGIDPASTSIEITYQNSPARNQTVAEYLQQTWQNTLGITVTLAPIEASTYIDWRASRETQPYGVYTGSWGSDFADPSNWHNQNFTSQSDHYRHHWVNEEYDNLAAEAVSNTDEAARNEEYQQAETILVTEAPIIPLYRNKAVRVAKNDVKDLFFQSILSVVHLRTVKIAAE